LWRCDGFLAGLRPFFFLPRTGFCTLSVPAAECFCGNTNFLPFFFFTGAFWFLHSAGKGFFLFFFSFMAPCSFFLQSLSRELSQQRTSCPIFSSRSSQKRQDDFSFGSSPFLFFPSLSFLKIFGPGTLRRLCSPINQGHGVFQDQKTSPIKSVLRRSHHSLSLLVFLYSVPLL